jgi:crotonobetainyl-CoA:carnitine CoA-transferase CaiB-like acyl-CoA transferase
MLTEVRHPADGNLKMVGLPVKFSGTQPSIRSAPPMLDQHTEEVLRDVLGYSSDKIEQLRNVRACFVTFNKTNE